MYGVIFKSILTKEAFFNLLLYAPGVDFKEHLKTIAAHWNWTCPQSIVAKFVDAQIAIPLPINAYKTRAR